MEQEHREQGKARGSTATSGQKTRLLAIALIFIVLAGAGFAIGEEVDETSQANNQDDNPKVIQLDGPIQPSAIITDRGEDIIQLRRIKTSSDVFSANNLASDYPITVDPESQGYSGDATYRRDEGSTDQSGIDDSWVADRLSQKEFNSLANQNIVKISPITAGEKAKLLRKKDPLYFQRKGPSALPWKYVGIKVIENKSYHLWMTAISVANANRIYVYFSNFFLKLGVVVHIYGNRETFKSQVMSSYVFNNSPSYSGTHLSMIQGDTVVVEYLSEDNNISPSNTPPFKITELLVFANEDHSNTFYNNTLLAKPCSVDICARPQWHKESKSVARILYKYTFVI